MHTRENWSLRYRARYPRALNWTVVSALVGLLIACAFMYAYVDAQTLRRDAGVFPQFVSLLGLGLFSIYLSSLFIKWCRGTGVSTVAEEDDDVDGLGVLRAYAITASLFLGTWLVGFHLAVPLFVVLYLRRYAKVRYRTLAPTFIGFVALITIVYGNFMATRWPQSVLEDRFMARPLQRTLMPLFQPLLDVWGL